jgi:hypothetical protein
LRRQKLLNRAKRNPMNRTTRRLALAAAALFLLPGGRAAAVQIRYHYAPADLCGTTALKPSGHCGSTGERVAWFGLVREPYQCDVRPTHMVTFVHPYTGRNVTVPLAFPLGTPRIEYRGDRVIYNYGSYTVEAHFLRDGSVETVYNTGIFRSF